MYYIPNFITESEESIIVDKVNTVPKPKWTQLSNRRLQNWGGIPHAKGMISEPIPQVLLIAYYASFIVSLLSKTNLFSLFKRERVYDGGNWPSLRRGEG